MEFVKIIRAVEEGVYEMASWIIFIPYTIFHVVRFPGKIPAYIRAELQKDEKEQFSSRMSPPLLWLLLVVVPVLVFVKNSGDLPARFAAKTTEQLMAYETTVCVSFLLTPALLSLLYARLPMNRNNLREFFFIQCYVQAPFSLVIGLLMFFLKTLHYDFDAMDRDNYIPVFNQVNGWKDLLMFLDVGFVFLLARAEYVVIRKHLECNAGKAISILVLSFFVGLVMMFVAAGMGMLFITQF